MGSDPKRAVAYPNPSIGAPALDQQQLHPVTLAALDPGIREHVALLHSAGIETFQSCEGGPVHAFPEPTVQFHGGQAEGWRALAVVLYYNDRPLGHLQALRRVWSIEDGAPVHPCWELVWYGPIEQKGRSGNGKP